MDSSGRLQSWRDGPAKSNILEFVRSVTEAGDSFAPPQERVATFDNDERCGARSRCTSRDTS